MARDNSIIIIKEVNDLILTINYSISISWYYITGKLYNGYII